MPPKRPQGRPNSRRDGARSAPKGGSHGQPQRGRGNRNRPRAPVHEELPQGPPTEFTGVFENAGRDAGFIREMSIGFMRRPTDPIMPRQMLHKLQLRNGAYIEGLSRQNRKGKAVVTDIQKINGLPPDEWMKTVPFDRGTVIAPEEHLVLEDETNDVSMRVVDLICPIGLGQRALIVSPARAGKTILLQKMAQSVANSQTGKRVVMLLVDERPEELTDMRRSVNGEIFGSSNDRDSESHLRVAQLAAEYAKRWVEAGEDVVLFLDSLTRLGRAFNRGQQGSGRTMSGGIDIKALEMPRKIFGAARKIENGGSLTIVATILVDTGSRMDEVIFEEFKGTGNSELVLDRSLVEERIFPAINIAKSGTRREELLWKGFTEALQMLRRYLSTLQARDATVKLIELVKKTPDNAALIRGIQNGSI